MYYLAVAIILSSVAFAQTAQQAEIALAAKSPMTLARYVESHGAFDWRALWSALGIQSPDFLYPLCGDRSVNLVYACSTEVVRVANPEQIILIIQSSGVRSHDIYLRYLRQKDGRWRFAGERSAALYDHYPRRHQITQIANKPFLKISSDLSQIGGGLAQEIEDWFDLAQPDFEPVFSFTPTGACCFGPVVFRKIKAQAIPREASGFETIELTLNVSFSAFMGELASSGYTGVYERPSAAGRFTLRHAYSGSGHSATIPTKEFEELADFGGLTDEESLIYALPGLQKIATGVDPKAKGWLRSVLAHTQDTPEKRSLLELLAKP
jgi:hypothetical protein